ncbi:hypothetical protein F-VV57_0182 [Faustovirus]|nr:hypothetical protein F-VV57_0182 [Faustovirus]QJX73449.1 hypothetical protein F-VV63_0183 [Faustovirus]
MSQLNTGLFPGITNDVYEYHLFPQVAEWMRLNRALDAYYRDNLGRGELIKATLEIHPMLAISPLTRHTVAAAARSQIETLILYAVHVGDFAMLTTIGANPKYRPYHITNEIMFTTLALHGHDDITKWLIYAHFVNFVNIKLESGARLETLTYDTIKPADFAKLVIRFLNDRRIGHEFRHNIRFSKMLKQYLCNLIDTRDRYALTIITGLRADRYGGSQNSIYLAVWWHVIKHRHRCGDVIISFIRSQRYRELFTHTLQCMHACRYELINVATQIARNNAIKLAILAGDVNAFAWLTARYQYVGAHYSARGIISQRDPTIYDVLAPFDQRVKLVMDGYNRLPGEVANGSLCLAVYFDEPKLLPIYKYWQIDPTETHHIVMDSKVAAYLYKNTTCNLKLRLKYEKYHKLECTLNTKRIVIYSTIDHCNNIIAALKYTREDDFVERYSANPSHHLTVQHRKIMAELIISRAYARLYNIIDSTCWPLALVYAHRYGNSGAIKYLNKKIRHFDITKATVINPGHLIY